MREQRELIGDPPPAGAAGPGRGAAAANAAQPARYPIFKYTVPDMFAGSVLNLEPDTEYECHFFLADPDGVTGATEKTSLFVPAGSPKRSRVATLTTFIPSGMRGRGKSRPLPD